MAHCFFDIKQSSLFDIKRMTFVALRVRSRPRYDVKDVKYLLKRTNIQKKLFGDTAYDAEWLHEYCWNNNIQTMIKPRKNVRRGFYRRKQMKNYSGNQIRSMFEGSNLQSKVCALEIFNRSFVNIIFINCLLLFLYEE